MLFKLDDFLAWRCKLLECFLMDDQFGHIGSGISLYHFTMFNDDVYIFVIMMYGRMHIELGILTSLPMMYCLVPSYVLM